MRGLCVASCSAASGIFFIFICPIDLLSHFFLRSRISTFSFFEKISIELDGRERDTVLYGSPFHFRPGLVCGGVLVGGGGAAAAAARSGCCYTKSPRGGSIDREWRRVTV